jgi:hypothetical protein
MVTTALVDGLIDEGQRLIDALEQGGVRVESALWFYHADSGDWRLLIGSPDFRGDPRLGYTLIRRALADIDRRTIDLSDTVVARTKDPLVRALRTTFPAGSAAAGTTIDRNVIGDAYVEGAYIYRL